MLLLMQLTSDLSADPLPSKCPLPLSCAENRRKFGFKIQFPRFYFQCRYAIQLYNIVRTVKRLSFPRATICCGRAKRVDIAPSYYYFILIINHFGLVGRKGPLCRSEDDESAAGMQCNAIWGCCHNGRDLKWFVPPTTRGVKQRCVGTLDPGPARTQFFSLEWIIMVVKGIKA